MKSILLVGALGAASVAGLSAAGVLPCPCEVYCSLVGGSECSFDAECGNDVRGEYVEARSCTVWAGGCHVNSEALSQGRRALAGWRFDAGSSDGVSLAGVAVAAAIEADENLGAHEVIATEAGSGPARRSVLFVDAPSVEAREAAVRWLETHAADALGDVRAVEAVAVTFEREGDAFRLEVPGTLTLAGDALADKSCCTMPESRWYSTLAETGSSVVGNPSTCTFEGAHGLGSWTYQDDNSAYVATFGARASADSACGAERADA